MAATSVLKLVVDDKEYNASLKNAKQGMQALQDSLQAAGKSFLDVDKSVVEYARALGQMETTSRTATGKLAEMKNTFTELSVVYKNMTDQEKASPMGKALAASLDQLKGRIQDSKVQLDDINKSINGGGGLSGALDNLASKFGMNVQSLVSWGSSLAAAKAGLDVAKDAFFASESTVDEWGRVVASSQAAYQGFLTALNTGDVSGYLNNINSIIQAAREAYNELDRLGTMKTIQAPKMSAQQTENERMRMMIQTGRYIAPIDGRRASMKDGQLLTPDQIRRIEQQLQNGMKSVVSLVGNEVKQTTKAIDAYYNSLAKQNGMSVSEFRRGTSSMAEFDRRIQGADAYKRWEREHTVYDERTGIAHRDQSVNPHEAFKSWGVFRVDKEGENSLKELVNLIKQRDSQAGQAYSMQSQAFRTMNRAEGVTVSKLMRGDTTGGGGGGTGGGTKSEQTEMQTLQASIKELEMEYIKLGGITSDAATKRRTEINQEISANEKRIAQIRLLTEQSHGRLLGGESAQTTGLGHVVELPQVGGGLSQETIDYIKNLKDGGKDVSNSWKTAASSISMVGNAMSGLKNPAIDIMTVIGQSIASIALAYSQNLANDKTTTGNIWAFIAAAAAATISMATTIASLHSITGYANGGMIEGNSYSGDNLMATGPDGGLIGLNAGEVILNRAQQNSLAGQLDGNGVGNLNLRGVLDGEKIVIVADRYLKRSGKGELAVWK